MLSSALQVGIFIPAGYMSPSDMANLLLKEEVANLALRRFLAFEITFQDYLDVLEVCGVDMDEFLQTADDNCSLIL